MNRSRLIRLSFALALGTAIALALLYRDRFDAAALEAWIGGAGWAGPLLFLLLYAVGTVLFLPALLMTLAGGALFGPLWGTLWNLAGGTLGAALAFLAARHLAGSWVERRIGGRLKRLKEGVEAEGWRFVAFVRLVPLFPFFLLNYALGLTRIPFWHYLLATAVFMLPGAVAYTWLGYTGREAVAGGGDLVRNLLIALGLVALIAFLPRLIARLRTGPVLAVEALKVRLDRGEDLLLLDVRTASDFVGEQGHLTAARNLPLEELTRRIPEIESYLERPVALICRTDRRSAEAARILTANGFADVHVVQGGMTAWLAKGWALE